MSIEKFEDIIAWKLARELSNRIHIEIKNCRDWSYKDQIERACMSIMNNIAEGFDRKGDKEFARFLIISKGSCAEVRSLLYLGEDREYIKTETAKELRNLSLRINKVLAGFITSLRTRDYPG